MNILLFFLVLYVHGVVPDDTIVTLPNGRIQGFISKTYRRGVPYYVFAGVPFAAPPVGNLRFKPPQSVHNWTGVLSTKAMTKTCYEMQKSNPTDNEDCLYLDVFTPVKPGSSPSLPVLIHIHGGGFTHGNGFRNSTKPHNFMERGVIIVSPNYRMGPFGFLSTGDTVIAGNMGLKDQQFAFKWVQTNIHLFGGDSMKVTILGQSAGGASVSYHMLSPRTAGLFRGAISQSSSALSSYAHQERPVEAAYKFAQRINPNFTTNHSIKDLEELLMGVEASVIAKTEYESGSFVPVIEAPHPGAFITKPMHELMKEGSFNRVPLLSGFCSEEEIAHLADLPSWRKSVKGMVPKNLVPRVMNLKDRSKQETVGEEIKEIYTNTSFEQHLGKAIQYYSDDAFIRSTIRFAELASRYTDVYFYQFSFQGKIRDNGLSEEGVSGVAHADDTYYLWATIDNNNSYPEADVKTVDRYVSLVSNFAKYSIPIPRKDALFDVLLPRMTPNYMYYLDIRKDLQVKINPREFSYQKWVQIFEAYGQQPFTSF